jgi:hypothetical protein
MPTHAVTWFDHTEARIFHVHPEARDETTILFPHHRPDLRAEISATRGFCEARPAPRRAWRDDRALAFKPRHCQRPHRVRPPRAASNSIGPVATAGTFFAATSWSPIDAARVRKHYRRAAARSKPKGSRYSCRLKLLSRMAPRHESRWAACSRSTGPCPTAGTPSAATSRVQAPRVVWGYKLEPETVERVALGSRIAADTREHIMVVIEKPEFGTSS